MVASCGRGWHPPRRPLQAAWKELSKGGKWQGNVTVIEAELPESISFGCEATVSSGHAVGQMVQKKGTLFPLLMSSWQMRNFGPFGCTQQAMFEETQTCERKARKKGAVLTKENSAPKTHEGKGAGALKPPEGKSAGGGKAVGGDDVSFERALGVGIFSEGVRGHHMRLQVAGLFNTLGFMVHNLRILCESCEITCAHIYMVPRPRD